MIWIILRVIIADVDVDHEMYIHGCLHNSVISGPLNTNYNFCFIESIKKKKKKDMA